MSPTQEMKVQWFLHQRQDGSKEIVPPNLHNELLHAYNWPVYGARSPCTKAIARAQGLNIRGGMGTHHRWQNSFSIVFEDSYYKGSTLQVMGMVVTRGQWAIVGGTGVFSCAKGVIHKKLLEKRCDGNIVELDIHFFYTPINWKLLENNAMKQC